MANTYNQKCNLQFVNNEGDEEEGLGHAGIETFKDAIYPSAARECGQNSADARLGDKTVRMTFDLIEVATKEFPALEQYKQVVDACLNKVKKGGEKEKDFFAQAKKVLEAGTIKILKISDENTKGLKGPCVAGTPFYSLVKGSGVTVKENEASGGSFGIGKNAAFALSDLQTVYYSTLYYSEDTKKEEFLAQGKTILISHIQNGENKASRGYWGFPNYKPVENQVDVPEWLRRNTIGTSIFAIGLREVQDWQYRMAASIIKNFFCAIHRGDMEFSINNGEISLNSSTLSTLFQNEKILAVVMESGEMDSFLFSKNLYECLTDSDVIHKDLSVPGLGDLSLKILIKEGLPKRLAIVRNGMIITDSLENFGDKFNRFKGYKDFVALVEPKDITGSAFIKKLENPQHNGLSAERIPDETKRHSAIKTMKAMIKEIRSAVKEEALPEPDEETALDELGEFFGDPDKRDVVPDPNAEDDPETSKVKQPTTPPKKPYVPPTKPSPEPGDTGGASPTGGTGTGNGGSNTGTGGGEGTGKAGEGKKSYKVPVYFTDFRNFILKGDPSHKRRVIFTPSGTGITSLTIQAAGIYESEPLSVASADGAQVKEGIIITDLVAGKRHALDVVFSEPFDGPIEIFGEREVVK